MEAQSAVRYLFIVSGIATVYFLTGQLGQLIAIPPGNITLLWPPAGIALAAVLLWGYPALPGIFIGAFLSNINEFSDAEVLSAVAFSAAVGLGSSLQSLWGKFLIEKILGHQEYFTSLKTTLRFVGVAPVLALVSASIGTAALFALSLDAASFEFTWSTWWIGDTLGIVLFTPIVNLLFRGAILGDRSWLIYLCITMSLVWLLVLVASLLITYRIFIDGQERKLLELAESHVELIEAEESLDLDSGSEGVSFEVREATLNRVRRAYSNIPPSDNASAYLIARESNGRIQFLASNVQNTSTLPTDIRIAEHPELPMARAIRGENGSLVGDDWRGVRVLAAYRHLDFLGAGLVVSMELQAARAPFVRAGTIVFFVSIALMLTGIYTFLRLSTPIMEIMGRKSRELQHLVDEQTQELKKSETQFREIIESSPNTIVIVNRKGTIEIVNKTLCQLTGYEPDELIGEPIEKLVPENAHTRHVGHVAAFMKAPEARTLDGGGTLYCRRKDGTEFPVEINLSLIPGKAEDCVLASFRDITERLAFERQLRDNEMRMEQALQAGNMEAYVVNLQTNTFNSNSYLYKRFGYDPDQATDKVNAWLEIVHPEDRDAFIAAQQSYADGFSDTFHKTYRVCTRDGEIRWVESKAKTAERFANGKPRIVIGSRVDITEKVMADLAVKEKLRELEDFNQFAVDRELRMIELKREINSLLVALGKPGKYEIDK